MSTSPQDPFTSRPASESTWSGGYGPPPQAWDAPGGPVRPGAPQTETKAIIALVCAIGSWVVLPLAPAIVALVLAGQARRDIEASGGWLTGDGLVTASKVVAWANIVLSLLVVVVVLLALLVFGAAFTL